MFRNLNFNSFLWILLGVGCFIAGSYFGWEYRRFITRAFPLPLGLLLIGLAMIFCGFTNGFVDQSPVGRKLRKLGILCFLGGLPLFVYSIYRNL